MNDRQKKVKFLLKKAEKLGLNIEKITEGKSIETLARNKNTLANFEKRFKRQKELPKIKQEVKRIDEKIQQRKKQREIEKEKRKSEQIKEQIRNFVSKKSLNQAKYNLGDENPTKSSLKEKTFNEISKFMDRYFKQLKHDVSAQKKINAFKKRFGVRLDLVYEFIDYITDLSFKYEIDRSIMLNEVPEEFNNMLRERLDEFDRVLLREFKI